MVGCFNKMTTQQIETWRLRDKTGKLKCKVGLIMDFINSHQLVGKTLTTEEIRTLFGYSKHTCLLDTMMYRWGLIERKSKGLYKFL